MKDKPTKTSQDLPEEIVSLLQQHVPQHLIFDDDQASPVDAAEMIKTGEEVSEECLKAYAAIVASHEDELSTFVDEVGEEQRERVLDILVRMSQDSASENASLLRNLSRCMSGLKRTKEAFELSSKARDVELSQFAHRSKARDVNLSEKETAYLAKIEAKPEDGEVLNTFALFLKNQRNDYARAEEYYRKAIAQSPRNATYLNNLAVLLMTSTHSYEEAEQCLRQSLEEEPNNANTVSNLANLLHNYRSQSQEAEDLYLRAIELNPTDGFVHINYAALLLCRNSWQKADEHLLRGWESQNLDRDRMRARVLFLKAASEALQGKDYAFYLGQLRVLAEIVTSHSPWSAGAIMEHLCDQLASSDFQFLQSLFNAITDWDRLAELNTLRRWTDQNPISLDKPWPRGIG